MHRCSSFFCGALLFGLVAGSDSKVNAELKTVADAAETKVQKPPPPMLELMSLSLDTWGLKGNNNTQKPPPEEVTVSGDGQVSHLAQPSDQFMAPGFRNDNPLAREPQDINMFDARANQPTIQPINFNVYSREVKNNLGHTLAILIFAMGLFVGLAYLVPLVCGDISEADEKVASASTESKAKLTEGVLSQSSWAKAYLEAEGEQKEALELLFRCNIISTEELACSVISQEHIQECTWIATHMLQHRPLEEWVALWQQAQKTFEDSVAECFEKQGGQQGFTARALAQRLKISRNQYVPPSSPAQSTSLPSSANLDFVSQDKSCDFRPLHS